MAEPEPQDVFKQSGERAKALLECGKLASVLALTLAFVSLCVFCTGIGYVPSANPTALVGALYATFAIGALGFLAASFTLLIPAAVFGVKTTLRDKLRIIYGLGAAWWLALTIWAAQVICGVVSLVVLERDWSAGLSVAVIYGAAAFAVVLIALCFWLLTLRRRQPPAAPASRGLEAAAGIPAPGGSPRARSADPAAPDAAAATGGKETPSLDPQPVRLTFDEWFEFVLGLVVPVMLAALSAALLAPAFGGKIWVLILVAAGFFGCDLLNTAILFHVRSSRKQWVLLLAVLLGFFFVLPPVPGTILRVLGLGGIRNASLVVTEKALPALSRVGVHPVLDGSGKPVADASGGYIVEDVDLLLRLGGEVLVRAPREPRRKGKGTNKADPIEDREAARTILPPDQVINSILPGRLPSPAESAASPPPGSPAPKSGS